MKLHFYCQVKQVSQLGYTIINGIIMTANLDAKPVPTNKE